MELPPPTAMTPSTLPLRASCDGRQHRGLRRVLAHLVKHQRREARIFQCRQYRLHQTDCHQARISDQQGSRHTQSPALARQLQRAAHTH